MDKSKHVFGIIYSRFGELGPQPHIWFPESLTHDAILEVIMRSTCFISVDLTNMHDKISIFPFPEYGIIGMNYYYIESENLSKEPIIASITLLINDESQNFFNRNLGNIKAKLRTLTRELNSNHNLHTTILSQYYLDIIELLNNYKSLEIFTDHDVITEDTGKVAVQLSYFHTKIGPMPFYIYPADLFDEETQNFISKELELEIYEGFFTRTYSKIVALHYYFEIPSKIARGKVEMCLLSFIFEKMPSSDTLHLITFKIQDLLEKLKDTPEIAFGFYTKVYKFKDKISKINEMNSFLRQWVKEVYDVCINSHKIN